MATPPKSFLKRGGGPKVQVFFSFAISCQRINVHALLKIVGLSVLEVDTNGFGVDVGDEEDLLIQRTGAAPVNVYFKCNGCGEFKANLFRPHKLDQTRKKKYLCHDCHKFFDPGMHFGFKSKYNTEVFIPMKRLVAINDELDKAMSMKGWYGIEETASLIREKEIIEDKLQKSPRYLVYCQVLKGMVRTW